MSGRYWDVRTCSWQGGDAQSQTATEAMAAAILVSLDAPPNRILLRRRAQDFRLERAANAYLDLLLGPTGIGARQD